MMDRKLLLGLSLVLISTCYDLTRSYLNSATSETKSTESSSSFYSHSDDLYEQSSTIPPPKMKKQTVPTIQFLFCSS
jgi:hypothetical protein